MHPLRKFKGFNSFWYQKRKNIKDRNHERAKERLAAIAVLMGYKVEQEKIFTNSIRAMHLYWPYQVDVFAYGHPSMQDLVLEADGEAHSKRRYKDNRRDKYFRNTEGVQTIRFGLEWLVGRDAVGDHKVKYRIIHGEWPHWRMSDEEVIRQIN